MTLIQLQYFLALSRTCHRALTAVQLRISQSTLDFAIFGLEQELGVKLFERRGNKLYLSKYGKAYAEKIRTALDLLDQANRDVTRMYNQDNGIINM